MKIILMATLAVVTVIVGGILIPHAIEVEWNTWQKAVNVLDERIGILEGTDKLTYLEERVNMLELKSVRNADDILRQNLGLSPTIITSNPANLWWPSYLVATGGVFYDINGNGKRDKNITTDDGRYLVEDWGPSGITVIAVDVSDHSKVKKVTTGASGGFEVALDNPGTYLIQALGGGDNSYVYINMTGYSSPPTPQIPYPLVDTG